MIEKRETTKKELKDLLGKYVKQGDHNTWCAGLVGHAQREMQTMHEKKDRAVRKMNNCDSQF